MTFLATFLVLNELTFTGGILCIFVVSRSSFSLTEATFFHNTCSSFENTHHPIKLNKGQNFQRVYMAYELKVHEKYDHSVASDSTQKHLPITSALL